MASVLESRPSTSSKAREIDEGAREQSPFIQEGFTILLLE